MSSLMRLPSPPGQYDTRWANQYTRTLEAENQALWSQLQQLQLSIVPQYTTVSRTALPDKQGQIVFDTDLLKLCFNTGSGWEIITSAP